jgi:2,3-diaminopropionate biosynthesis protein SbnA
MIYDSILDTIGETPIVRLQHVRSTTDSDILVKVEGTNPGGSIKDRPAALIVLEAERRGELLPNGTIIESTSGNFGKALALIGAARRYQVILVVDPKAPESMIRFCEAFGARIEMVDTPDEDGGFQRVRIRRVRELLDEIPGSYWPNQYDNPDNPKAHAQFTAQEILRDLDDLDALVASVSTGGHISGLSKALKEELPNLQVIAVDAVGSSIFGFPFHHYMTRGWGLAWVPDNLSLDAIDRLHRVGDAEAIATARIVARWEGLLIGESAGAATFAALHHAHLHRESRILVIAADTGANYVDESFVDTWLSSHGMTAALPSDPAALLEWVRSPQLPPIGVEDAALALA